MTDARLADFARRMDGALEALRKEFAGLRTGRASVNLLDSVQVDAYGGNMHLSQLATVSVPELRLSTRRSAKRVWASIRSRTARRFACLSLS
jgi:ribosome recycling factor